MSSISSATSYASSLQHMQRPDPSKMADKLFSKLDTKNQGYLEKSDLQSAFSQISSAGGSGDGASVDEIFTQLDGDGDGKVTKDEMSSSLKKLAEQLDSQFNQMRMGGGQGMPPPPPGGMNDAGFSRDQLSGMASSTASSDSTLSGKLSSLSDNFDKADTDGDGKISFKEAMAYEQSSAASTGNAPDASSTAKTRDSASSEQAIMKRIMDLMQAYNGNDASKTSLPSTLSVLA